MSAHVSGSSAVAELCRRLKPVLGEKVDRLWRIYLAESDRTARGEIEQVLELLAAKHLDHSYEPDRAPFPPPPRDVAGKGDLSIGEVAYGGRSLYPLNLPSQRLKEHLLIAGRSGSGKTNLTFILTDSLIQRGIKVLALDWKRGYRDLLQRHENLRVYTIGRDVSPFAFNPLIPPQGCEPHVWIKLIVDVIASAYLGGEGVISLLVAGLDHLYRDAGVFDQTVTRWPTVNDLLVWLRTTKRTGRAAMWQASTERILVGMTYGEFASVLNTQDNSQVSRLLDHNVVMEMDGLSSSSDRVLFSEALTLYLYRFLLARGPRQKLSNVIVLEEAHNLLLAKASGSRESVLENSIRMIRQYGLGYVFVDQSASLLSKVAFANCYGMIALSQKLSADVRAIGSAMNLSDEQKQALSTLPVGSAVVRLSDDHPEPFMIRVPAAGIDEGAVDDEQVRHSVPPEDRQVIPGGDSTGIQRKQAARTVVTPIPPPEEKKQNISAATNPPNHVPRPPPLDDQSDQDPIDHEDRQSNEEPLPEDALTREAIRFLSDVAVRPLSTTVRRYQRLHLSRRRGNAIRKSLCQAHLVMPVTIATRSGQVVLHDLTDDGRAMCDRLGVTMQPRLQAGLEHRYWADRAACHYEQMGYVVTHEYQVAGNGAIDLLAERGGQRLHIEIETGKSDIVANLQKARHAGFDRLVMLATSPTAVNACHRALKKAGRDEDPGVQMMTWLDLD